MGQAVHLHYVAWTIDPKATFYCFPDLGLQDEDSVPISDVFKMPTPVELEMGRRYGFQWQKIDLQKALDALNIKFRFYKLFDNKYACV